MNRTYLTVFPWERERWKDVAWGGLIKKLQSSLSLFPMGPMSSPLDLGRLMTASSYSTVEDSTELFGLGHKELCSFCLVLLEHLRSGSAPSPGTSQNPTTMLWGSPSHMERPHVGPQYTVPAEPSLGVTPAQEPDIWVKKFPNDCSPQVDATPDIIKQRQAIILTLPCPHTWPRKEWGAKLIVSTDDGFFVCY